MKFNDAILAAYSLASSGFSDSGNCWGDCRFKLFEGG